MPFGFAGLLAIIFITLKLCAVITWAWVWVLAPLWSGLLVGIIIVVFLVIYGWRRKGVISRHPRQYRYV